MMGNYWRNDETPEAIKAIEVETWLDVLEEFTDDEIHAAWTEYQRTGPRTARGALYKPDPGALYHIIQNRRAPAREAAYRRMLDEELAKKAREDAERKASVPTLERAKQIIAEVSAKLTDKPQGEEK
jgi:hypothetical protein